MSKQNSRILTGLGKYRFLTYKTSIIANKRGFYTLGPTDLVSGDPFGLFHTTQTLPGKKSLIVHPKIYNLQNFPFNIDLSAGGTTTGVLYSMQASPQVAGVREYYPGDPLNHVHWPTTVKRNRLMVKEFDDDIRASVWIIFDIQKGKYIHLAQDQEAAIDRNYATEFRNRIFQLPRDSFEYAVCIAASLANSFVRRGYSSWLGICGRRNNNFES